jgi:hypothetical protein
VLYETALLPEIFDESVHTADHSRSIVLKTILRDLAVNGLLADLHKSAWRKQILERIEALPPQLRQDVVKSLTTLMSRNRLVRHPRASHPVATDHDWLSLAATLENLHAIVANAVGTTVSCDNLVELDRVLDSELWSKRPTTWTVPMDRAGYAAALTPLLRYARKLLLIDPYLKADQAYVPVVELCARLLGFGRGDPKGMIEIHAKRQDQSVGNWFKAWRAVLEPLHSTYGHAFKVCLYETPTEGQRFHDRFILTDQCGVSVPAGLSLVSGSSTDWLLMEYEVANARRADFESSVHPYLNHVSLEPMNIP